MRHSTGPGTPQPHDILGLPDRGRLPNMSVGAAPATCGPHRGAASEVSLVPLATDLYEAPFSLPGVLLLERDPLETFFVESLVHRVLRADVWLWHEERLDIAFKVLAVTSFRLILLGAPFPRVSNRQLIRRVREFAPRTPILLRLPPDQLPPKRLDPRVYGVTTVAPKQHAESVLQAVRRVLPR